VAIQAQQPGAEEEKKKEEVTLGSQPVTGPSGAPAGGGAPSQAGSGPTSSGAYSDVGQYLKANKPRISSYAQDIAGKVSTQAQEAQGKVATQAEEAQTTIEEARLPGADIYEGKDARDVNVEQAQNILTGSSGGLTPEKIALSEIAGLEKVKNLADLSQNYGGSKTLIKETVAPEQGRYTGGMYSLGASALQRDPTARDTLQGLRSSTGQFLEDARTQEEGLRTSAG
jgi:hypothetical protein